MNSTGNGWLMRLVKFLFYKRERKLPKVQIYLMKP